MANALSKIKADALTADLIDETKLADNSIDSEHYNDGSIDHAHLANDAVDGDNIADNAINSEHYVDASIDHAHLANDCVDGDNLADNAVDSEHYTDGSIDTAHIADDQITLAKMASGTDGQIITYDASGNPVAVGPGTDGQVLTSTGAGSPPAFEDAAGGITPSMLINGEMRIAQRGTSFNFAHDGDRNKWTLDHWRLYFAQLDEWDCVVSQDSSAPPGFSKSLKLTTGTAEGGLDNDHYGYIDTKLEGFDVQRLGYGAGTAKSATLSFWVRSSQTGTFGFTVFRGETQDRAVNLPYSISSADTWEKKTIVVPGDTSDAITETNTERMRLVWGIVAGSNFTSSGAGNTWFDYNGSSQFLAGHAQNGVALNANATWYLTGVKFELGSTATDFDHQRYSDDLRRCQRYYYRITNSDNIYMTLVRDHTEYKRLTVAHPTTMRANPTVTILASDADGDASIAVDMSDEHLVHFKQDATNSTTSGSIDSWECDAELS